MRYGKWSLCVAALLLAAACGGTAGDEYADATPDYAGMSLEITGDASEGPSLRFAPLGEQAVTGTDAPWLTNARAGIRELNGSVRDVVGPIVDLIKANAKDLSASSKAFGPKDEGNVTYLLTIAKISDGTFAWKLEGKPLGADDAAYVIVAAGRLKKGELPHRGRGTMGVDLDNLASIDSTFTGQGKLLVAFAHQGDTKTLVYFLKDFTRDPAVHPPITAAFVGHRLADTGATGVRLAAKLNLPDTATDAIETVRSRVRWLPGVGGRADLLVTDGDVPAGKVWYGSECWNAQEQEGYRVINECDQGDASSCTVVKTVGDSSACAAGLRTASPPPMDPTDTSANPEDPTTDLTPPTDLPVTP
jgi:hypothetical protein